jgi:hypothetical protein
MKILFQFILSALIFSQAIGQCDMAAGISSKFNTIGVGENSEISVDLVNLGGGKCSNPKGSVRTVVALPSKGTSFTSFVSPIHGDFFDWTFDAIENVIVGVNHTAIPDGMGEHATFNLTATETSTYPYVSKIGINVSPIGEGWSSNNKDNDNGATVVIVQRATLPKGAINIKGIKMASKHQLLWTTINDIKTNTFEVERSNNGIDWEKIGIKIIANVNTSSPQNYETTIENPILGPSYYRILSIESKGEISYSKVVILNEDKKGFAIFPTPANTQLTILIPSELKLSNDVVLNIQDLAGKIVLSKKLDTSLQQVELDVNNLSNGSYIIKINGENNFSQKMTIQH